MAHPQQQEFVASIKQIFPKFFKQKRVLEIGSLDINGSVRQHFEMCDHIGIDVAPGPGVDIVCQGQEFAAPDSSFDVVISCEVMEHNPYWKETFQNMIRLCKPGGLVLMTCATVGRPEHGTTRTSTNDSPLTIAIGWDYYRNLTSSDFKKLIPIRNWFSVHMFCSSYSFWDLYFVGFRIGASAPPRARTALEGLRLRYFRQNLASWEQLRARFLISLVGERRYMAGPIRPWRTGGSCAR